MGSGSDIKTWSDFTDLEKAIVVGLIVGVALIVVGVWVTWGDGAALMTLGFTIVCTAVWMMQILYHD